MAEREIIELHRRLGESWTQVARRIGRQPSTAWREMRRNSFAPDIYRAQQADERARRRRHQPRRTLRLSDARLRSRIGARLGIGWSPGLVARFVPGSGSARTIYRAARSFMAHAWAGLLGGTSGAERERRRKRERIHQRVMLDLRPAHVALREEPGHWEGDTIRSVAGSKAGLLVLVERTSRLVRLALLPDQRAATLNAAAQRLLAGFTVRSLTVDNGMEFASHRKLSALIGAPVYFCHEHSPWERGTCEQTNKLIRYYIPKGCDVAGCSRAYIALIEELLNTRPRRVLNYLSPEQSMSQASPSRLCT
jgi:IS30 family transposase